MAKPKLDLTTRIALGLRQMSPTSSVRKDFIPALSPYDGFSMSGIFGRMKDFKTKPEQLTANVGWVFSANSAIADEAAAVEIKLYRKMKDGDREEIFQHELLDLIAAPNLALTGEQMRQLHFTYMNLVGESYLVKYKGAEPLTNPKQIPDALHLIPAAAAEFKLGDSFSESYLKVGTAQYPLASLIRDIRPDPVNPYKGRSIIAAAAAAIDTDEQMKEWNRHFFANSARPSLVFTVPDGMSDESFDRFRKQINDTMTGTDNAFKPIIVEGASDAKPFMMSQTDLDFLASREFSQKEIFAMFKVPAAMVGMTADYNRANIDGARYINATLNIRPRLRQFVNLLNVALVKPIDPTLELDFENPVPEDATAKQALAVAMVDKWATKDEVRDMFGMEPLPDGEGSQILVPMTSIPLSQVLSDPTDPGSDADDDIDDPLDPDNDDDDPTGGGSRPTDEDDGTPTGKSQKKKTLTIKGKALDRRQYGETKSKLYNKNAITWEKHVMFTIRAQFEAQRNDVLSKIDHLQLGKAVYRKGILDDLVDWVKHNAALQKALSPLLFSIISETGKFAMGEVADPSLFDPYSKAIQQYYDGRSTMVAGDVDAETDKQLKASLAAGIQNNESSFELKARVEQVFGAAASYRSERIARTEVASSQTFADIEAWKQSGVVTAKEWYTAEDEHVCEFCEPMDNQIVEIDDDYFQKGDVMTGNKGGTLNLNYTDIGGAPLHANCRCVLLPVTIPIDQLN